MSPRHVLCNLLAALWFAGAIASVRGDAPAPEVLFTLSGPVKGELETGTPLFVSVRIEAPAESGSKLVLAPATGDWRSAVTVELAPGAGGATTLPARPAGPEEESGSFVLDAEQAAEGVWLFTTAELGRLSPGSYRVLVRLAIAGGTGWKGTVAGDDCSIRLIAAPANRTPEELDRRALAVANEAMATGDFTQAARVLDERLNLDPNQVELLQARAVLCLRGGNLPAANACVNRAWVRVTQEQWKHPPQGLYVLSQGIAQALMSGPPPTTAPLPEWSVPPGNVIEPIQDIKPTPSSATPAAGTASPVVATASATVPATSPGNASAPPPATAGAEPFGAIVPFAELTDAKIVADPAGQWAANAVAGTQYGKTQYSAMQATGAPNIKVAGNSPDAWCPATRTGGRDWLEVTFAKPVQATEVRVRQTDAAGALVKVEAIEPNGAVHVWWEGVDPYVAPAIREIAWFAVRVPKTSYAVAKVKLTLNLASGPGYKQIDAVQLVGAP